jgi:very-short-patch-repair endonuclease
MAEFPHRVRRLVVVQGGAVARYQLLARGMTDGSIEHAREVGRLGDLHRGVYCAIPRELLGEDAHLIAALLATRGRAVLSHGTAAWRWKLIPAQPLQIELASRLELVEPRGVRLHRTELRMWDTGPNGRFRSTNVTRTLLDLAVRYEEAPLLRALEEAEFHHGVTPAHALAVLRRGHAGSARLRAALDVHVPGYGAMRSRLERRFRKLLIAYGVSLPVRNRRIGPWIVDCIWLDLRVVVELDGGQHERPHQAAVDAERDLWLRRNGYIVRRYTWEQVTARDASDVIADLLDAFAEARARALPKAPR